MRILATAWVFGATLLVAACGHFYPDNISDPGKLANIPADRKPLLEAALTNDIYITVRAKYEAPAKAAPNAINPSTLCVARGLKLESNKTTLVLLAGVQYGDVNVQNIPVFGFTYDDEDSTKCKLEGGMEVFTPAVWLDTVNPLSVRFAYAYESATKVPVAELEKLIVGVATEAVAIGLAGPTSGASHLVKLATKDTLDAWGKRAETEVNKRFSTTLSLKDSFETNLGSGQTNFTTFSVPLLYREDSKATPQDAGKIVFTILPQPSLSNVSLSTKGYPLIKDEPLDRLPDVKVGTAGLTQAIADARTLLRALKESDDPNTICNGAFAHLQPFPLSNVDGAWIRWRLLMDEWKDKFNVASKYTALNCLTGYTRLFIDLGLPYRSDLPTVEDDAKKEREKMIASRTDIAFREKVSPLLDNLGCGLSTKCRSLAGVGSRAEYLDSKVFKRHYPLTVDARVSFPAMGIETAASTDYRDASSVQYALRKLEKADLNCYLRTHAGKVAGEPYFAKALYHDTSGTFAALRVKVLSTGEGDDEEFYVSSLTFDAVGNDDRRDWSDRHISGSCDKLLTALDDDKSANIRDIANNLE